MAARYTQEPQKYVARYAAEARKLVLWGAGDPMLAEFFGVALRTIRRWRRDHPEFARAVDPTPQERAEYAALHASRRLSHSTAKRLASHIRRIDPSQRLTDAMRARMNAALKGRQNTSAALRRLGYSVTELRAHLESRFLPDMTWQNYGAWHVDHIKPCASFNQSDPAQFAECWALANLRPLWAIDNIRKGSRSPRPAGGAP